MGVDFERTGLSQNTKNPKNRCDSNAIQTLHFE